MSPAVVILAAGAGTRMQSRLAKSLHPVCGRTMLAWVLAAAEPLCEGRPVVVTAPDADDLRAACGDAADTCVQPAALGTGDAVRHARALVSTDTDTTLVLCGDMPLIRSSLLRRLVDRQRSGSGPGLAFASVDRAESQGFGRILRDAAGTVREVVEERDCTPAQLEVTELNAGVYAFPTPWLFARADDLPVQANGERYLTDLVGTAVRDGLSVQAVSVDPDDVWGVNDRVQLARVAHLMRQRINRGHMYRGVTLVDPDHTYIDADVRIGRDTLILPGTLLTGNTDIGEGCTIGPHTELDHTRVGEGSEVRHSVVEEADIGRECMIGPFARIRRGTRTGSHLHMGSFGEIKNSSLGADIHMGHFSYVGDSDVGDGVNVGAGTITCNFDGRAKHRTVIEDGVFLGSGTTLVAPVRVSRGAMTGAGSVVTRDLPAETLAYGVPAKPRRPVGEGPRRQESNREDPPS